LLRVSLTGLTASAAMLISPVVGRLRLWGLRLGLDGAVVSPPDSLRFAFG
jgi:hypothetical protein